MKKDLHVIMIPGLNDQNFLQKTAFNFPQLGGIYSSVFYAREIVKFLEKQK